MIRSEKEYTIAKRRLLEDRQFIHEQRSALVEQGLTGQEIERVMEPTLTFHEQLKEEVQWYERVRRRDFDALRNLQGLGRLLIAVRIANGLSQRDLAERLGVSEAQVSRDERNEYHGITADRARKILDALGETLNSEIEHRELISA